MKRTGAMAVACLLAIWLTACGQQDVPPQTGGTDGSPAAQEVTLWENQLTEEELTAANEAFSSTVQDENGGTTSTVISCFFTCTYDTPEDISLERFLYLYPDNICLTNEDAAEFAALTALEEYTMGDAAVPSDLPVPTHRYRASDVNDTLLQYAGITVDELTNTANVLYLPEYGAYYNFTSDFGPGMFSCVGGAQDGDTLRLWGEEKGESGSHRVLTLCREGDSWLIHSFRDEVQHSDGSFSPV